MSNWQTSSWSIMPMAGGGALQHATGTSLSSWFLKAAGLSCSTTTAGSWFQSPTVLAANELWSPDEDAPIALNLNRWFALLCYPHPQSQSGQDQQPHVQWRPCTIKPVWGLAGDHSDLANRGHAASDVVLWSPLTNVADRRCIFSSKSQFLPQSQSLAQIFSTMFRGWVPDQ